MQSNGDSGSFNGRDEVWKLQASIFGRRFAGASLSTFDLAEYPKGTTDLIFSWMKKPNRMLVFLGCSGIGKTHFCSALVACAYHKNVNFRYFKEADLFERVFSKMGKGHDSSYHVEQAIDATLFIYDDLGSKSSSEWSHEIISTALDARYKSQLPTLVTSNLTRLEILEKYGERVHDRLFASENVLIECHSTPSKRTRCVYPKT